MEHVCTTIVKTRQTTWPTFVKKHNHQSSKHMITQNQKTWSQIVKTHDQTHSQQSLKTWSNIVNVLATWNSAKGVPISL
jgi:hypothetical protein